MRGQIVIEGMQTPAAVSQYMIRLPIVALDFAAANVTAFSRRR
jgi:hypothetical protein